MSKEKTVNASAALVQRKKNRRRTLNFIRICRYGINNFSRNIWLTTAAIAVMAVTLIIVFSTLTVRNVFEDTLTNLRAKVDVSFYLADTVTDTQQQALIKRLHQDPIVTNVRYLSADDVRQEFAKENASDATSLQALELLGDTNYFPATIRINVNDPGKLDRLDKIFATPQFKAAQNPDPNLVPSTKGKNRESIDKIARWAWWAERGGLVLCFIGIIISVLIIFNTIRMAIFTRRDEIQMMKLIGAGKSFIQGPFVMEAVMYGVVAALITAVICYLSLLAIKTSALESAGIIIQPTIDFLTSFPSLVILGLVLVGAAIGVVSSLLAIRRHLKV